MMPKKWETPEQLKEQVDAYIANTKSEEMTVTGLCIYLGVVRQTLLNYMEEDGFKPIIQWAKLHIENAYEKALRKHGRSGDIFALKNFGWSDKQELEMSGPGGGPLNVSIEFVRSEKDGNDD